MQPVNYYTVTSQQVTKHPTGVIKLEATPTSGAVATQWLQIHDSAVVPAEDSVPVKSWPLYECGYKEFKRGELRLSKGLYICISSTADVKTLTGVTDTVALLQVELWEPDSPTGTTYAGDETTTVTNRTLWNNASGPQALLEVIVNDTGASLVEDYPKLLVYALTASTEILVQVVPIKKATRNVVNFGKDGLVPRKVGASGVGVGCSVVLGYYDTVTEAIIAPVSVGTAIKAEFKDLVP